jgi:hypothetical protein
LRTSDRTRVLRPVVAVLALFAAVRAEARLVLPAPPELGVFAAETYDEDGRRRIGTATLALEERGGGRVQARVETAVRGGGRMWATADLERAPGGLRLLNEESQSFEPDGTPFPLLQIDHVTRVATCTPPPGSADRFRRIDLPEEEQIVNVPMNLLFLPLVFGRTDELAFQIFICGRGGRVIDFVARARNLDAADGRNVVEVRYQPDFGSFSWLASPLAPNLTFWFEREGGRYLAHRMLLYPGGPEVVVAREGVTPEAIFER